MVDRLIPVLLVVFVVLVLVVGIDTMYQINTIDYISIIGK